MPTLPRSTATQRGWAAWRLSGPSGAQTRAFVAHDHPMKRPGGDRLTAAMRFRMQPETVTKTFQLPARMGTSWTIH
jgi:hypothetical protein